MTNSEHSDRLRKEIAEIARAMLGQHMSFTEGALRIQELWHSARLPDLDPDVLPIEGIISEADHFPLGDARKHWASDALEKLQPEFERAEEWARQFASVACQKLIDRFDPSTP
jgi:Protein of unknown function (DUF2489)